MIVNGPWAIDIFYSAIVNRPFTGPVDLWHFSLD